MNNEGYHVFDGDTLIIMTCSDCNTKCEHCYITYNGNFSKEKLNELVKNFSDKLEVRINGTEPLLHKEYLEALKEARQTKILTNGLVFKNNYEYLDELKKIGIKTIGISYHFDIHDSISHVSKLYLDELFNVIMEKGLNVQIMTTITSENYKLIPKYCEYCYEKGIRRIRFTNFMRQGNGKNLNDHLILSNEEREEFFSILKMVREKYDIEKLRIERCGSFGKSQTLPSNFECPSGLKSIVITPDYKIYPCIFLINPENEIGFYEDGMIYVKDNYNLKSDECNAILKLNKR